MIGAGYVIFIAGDKSARDLVGSPANNSTGNTTDQSKCVMQRTGCCSCSMGGSSVCMTEDQAKIKEDQLKAQCGMTFCTAVMNCRDVTCSYENGECKEKPID
jgi:hypothetical protein